MYHGPWFMVNGALRLNYNNKYSQECKFNSWNDKYDWTQQAEFCLIFQYGMWIYLFNFKLILFFAIYIYTHIDTQNIRKNTACNNKFFRYIRLKNVPINVCVFCDYKRAINQLMFQQNYGNFFFGFYIFWYYTKNYEGSGIGLIKIK